METFVGLPKPILTPRDLVCLVVSTLAVPPLSDTQIKAAHLWVLVLTANNDRTQATPCHSLLDTSKQIKTDCPCELVTETGICTTRSCTISTQSSCFFFVEPLTMSSREKVEIRNIRANRSQSYAYYSIQTFNVCFGYFCCVFLFCSYYLTELKHSIEYAVLPNQKLCGRLYSCP